MQFNNELIQLWKKLNIIFTAYNIKDFTINELKTITNTYNINSNNNASDIHNIISFIKDISKLILKQKAIVSYPNLFQISHNHKTKLSQKQIIGQNIYANTNINFIQKDKQKHIKQQQQRCRNNKQWQQSKIVLTHKNLIQFINYLIAIQSQLSNTLYDYQLQSIIIQFCHLINKSNEQHKSEYKQILQQQTSQCKYFKQIQQDISWETFSIQEISKQFKSKPLNQLLNPKVYQGSFRNISALYQYFNQFLLPFVTKQFQQSQNLQLANNYIILLNSIIHQIQIQIEISKNSLIQTRIYNAPIQSQLIFRILKFQNINLNILKFVLSQQESNISLQQKLFKIIRRLYYYIGNNVRDLLIQVITNISLFAQQESQKRQAAMFCYKLTQEKTDQILASLIQQSDDFKNIRSSKYFSSKAYIFCSQITTIYTLKQTNCLPFWHFSQKILNRDTFSYKILIQKPSTLLIWQFYLLAFDIKFGIFKVQNYKDFLIQQYISQINCKQILKFQRVSGTKQQPNKGHLFLRPGLYHLVFDNSFSLWREKKIIYMFTQLQMEV